MTKIIDLNSATTATGGFVPLYQDGETKKIDAALLTGTGSTTAASVSYTPAGNIAATNVQAAINELDSEKEPTITAGTILQYWRGDKSWRDFATDVKDTVLSGLSTATNAVITASDSVLSALGKLQAQVSLKANTANVREKLTAARTYYVRTDGSDSNTGLTNTAGGAFLTIQKAIDTVCTLDLSIYDCFIQIVDGTYTNGYTLKPVVTGGGLAQIVGNTATPANVLISTTSASCISGADAGKWRVSGMKLQTTTSGYGVIVSGKTTSLDLRNMNYGACVNGHVVSASGAFIRFNAAWSISGSSPVHLLATDGSTIIAVGQTCTLTGTPAFTTFASCGSLSLMNLASNTFSGSATGSRYSVSTLSLINTSGGGGTYLPGSTGGSNDGTGVYA